MIAVAMLALVLAGGLSPLLAVLFLGVMVGSWLLEKTKWQLPERYGLGVSNKFLTQRAAEDRRVISSL